jgi:hypothetical protein
MSCIFNEHSPNRTWTHCVSVMDLKMETDPVTKVHSFRILSDGQPQKLCNSKCDVVILAPKV